MICLDTNAVIAVLNGNSPKVVDHFNALAPSRVVALPVVVLFELKYGLAKSTRRPLSEQRLKRLLDLPLPILPFQEDDAEHAADIRATLARAGTPIGPYDVLIAAQARCRGATLVTANMREFQRVPGLALEDWTLPA